MDNNTSFSNERFSKKPLMAYEIHKTYGDKRILNRETVTLNTGDKIGLVGRNGSGKSTLIKILAGIEKPDTGEVINPNLKIGYIPQDFIPDANHKTVYEVATEEVEDTQEDLEGFTKLSVNYKAGDPALLERYEKFINLIGMKNGYDLQDRVNSLLDNFGLGKKSKALVSTLSGGEVMRLALARMLVLNPDVLLLDEPTNHLDLHASLWLEEFLTGWQGGLLLVSHDRAFLNDVTTTIWELEEGHLRVFGGNYAFYKEQKGIEAGAREREVARLTRKVQQAKVFINKEQKRSAHSAKRDLSRSPEDHDRARAHYFKERATRTAGRKKKLAEIKRDKLIDELEKAKRKLTPKIIPDIKESESYKGKTLVEIRNLTCCYGEMSVFENVSLLLNFGDRIALFGNNGSGKSTLIGGILGLGGVSTRGEIKLATNINLQLLDQTYALIDKSQTVFENMRRVAPQLNNEDLRQHLARFLFRGDTAVSKESSILSGGEIARLAFAMISVQPLDLLVLDEPINNLDVASIEEIEYVLASFRGAILVISHDLTFLRNIGIRSSYVISNKLLRKLMANPEDGEYFTSELLSFL